MRRIPSQPHSRTREYGRQWKANARKAWTEEKKERARQAVRRHYQSKGRYARYGITKEIYDEQVERQGGLCAGCLALPYDGKLCIDHDHETGEFRALLCRKCNAALGLLGDRAEVLGRLLALVSANG